MKEKIALGIHAVVDWEGKWDADVLRGLVEEYDIKESEIALPDNIDSERKLLCAVLYYMKHGAGAELFPVSDEIVESFAKKFQYKVTIGGTAARAAIALAKIGVGSLLQMSTCNDTMRKLLPDLIHGIPANPNCEEKIYPHVSVSYPKGYHLKTENLDFITPRENRVLYSHDLESFHLPVLENFADYAPDAEVFLLSSFCEVLDEEVMKDRMAKCRKMLGKMRQNGTFVVFEDACYVKQNLRKYVNDQLHEYIDILSMNEDEMMDYTGCKIDVMDPDAVLKAIKEIYEKLKVPVLFVHSSAWAIAYGKDAQKYYSTLESGITMASTRFRYGDDYGIEEFNEVKNIAPAKANVDFSREIMEKCPQLYCVPCKDMSFVKHPTSVGLGDSFCGGLLIDLIKKK
ncbi:MAG: ADP-dependent glucokinase/phosphofructokinase [Eubacteriales bacterium]|nr:ADP-dependent glucokinase/phosphofructokinase [Eubacteriales bacterium]